MIRKIILTTIIFLSCLAGGEAATNNRKELRQAIRNLSGRSQIVSFGESNNKVISCNNFQQRAGIVIFEYNDGLLIRKFEFYSKGTAYLTLGGNEIVVRFQRGTGIGFEQNNGQLLSLNLKRNVEN